MKFDLDEVLRDVWGKPIVSVPSRPKTDTDPGREEERLTLGMACANAFLTPAKGDEADDSVAARVKMHQYAKRFAAGGVIDLSIEDLGEVRKRVAKIYYPAISGPVLELLDLKEEKPADRSRSRAA